MRWYLRVFLALAAACPLSPPVASADPAGIVWKVSNRLPLFAEPGDAERYLEIVRRINPSHSRDFRDKYAETSPFPRDRPLPATRWDPRLERYDGKSMLAPTTIDAWIEGSETGDRCAWFVDGRPLGGEGACVARRIAVPAAPAVSRLSVVRRRVGGSSWAAVAHVAPRRTIIVALGDSYASGEGVPDRALGRRDAADWWDRRCHRSLFAGPALAAATLAESDPHRSVIFMSFACSGARLPQLLARPEPGSIEPEERMAAGQEPPEEIRALFRQRFPNRALPPIPAARLLVPQVRAAAEALCDGDYDAQRGRCAGMMSRPDYVTLSIGGNDLRFVDLLKDMLTTRLSDRRRAEWEAWLDENRRTLGQRLDMLARDLEASLHPRAVLVTEYPDPLRDDGETAISRPGGLCDDLKNWAYNWQRMRIVRPTLGLRLTPVTAQESDFALERFLKPLNIKIANAAKDNQALGWRLVRGISRAAGRYGYCSRWSHFRTAQQALHQQGPQSYLYGQPAISLGTAHPNMQGHWLYGCMIAARINALEHVRPWRAPLPWAPACRGNGWDALLENNEWIGPEGREPVTVAEAASPGRSALEQRRKLDLGRPEELVDRAHLPQGEAAVD